MEERLERLKSRLQRTKSSLYITPRTPMGNVLLVEGLLDSFERSERRGMVSEGHNSSLFTFGSSLFCQDRPACNVATETDLCGQDDLPYVLSSGENTTGCFDVHTASKPDEAYFIASTDATKQILGRVEKTDPHSADYPLTPVRGLLYGLLRGLLYGLVRGLPCGLP